MAYSDVVLADSPVVYARMNETSGTTATDSSGNAHTGTWSGAPGWGATSLISDPTGKAADINGQYINYGYAAWEDASYLTLECWVVFDGFGQTPGLWDRDPNGGRVFQWRVETSGRLNLIYWLASGAQSNVQANTALVAGNKYHLVTTYDGAVFKTYINGVLDVSVTVAGSMSLAASQLNFGRSGWGSGYFDGRAQEAAYYNHALTADRVIAHYNAGMEEATAPTGTVQNLRGTGISSQAIVKWNTYTGATAGYDWRVNGGAPTTVTTTSATITGLTNGTTYNVEVRAKNSHGDGPWSSVSVTPKATYVYDDFERADVAPSATALGAPVQGPASWTQPSGSLGITGGKVYASAAAENYAFVSAASDVDIRVTLGDSTAGANWGVIFRYKDASNFWLVNPDALYRKISGTFVKMSTHDPGQTNITRTAGDVWRVHAYQKRIRFYRNGVLINNFYDAYYDSSAVGAGLRQYDTSGRTDDIVVYDANASEFGDRAGGTRTDVQVAGSRVLTPIFVYKGRNTKAADSGSVA